MNIISSANLFDLLSAYNFENEETIYHKTADNNTKAGFQISRWDVTHKANRCAAAITSKSFA
jgi:hypothetical protein